MGVCISKALHLTQDLLLHYGECLTFDARYGTVEVLDDARRDFFTSLYAFFHQEVMLKIIRARSMVNLSWLIL